MSREHGFRGEELDDIKRDRDALRVNLEQATKEKIPFVPPWIML